MKTLTAIAALVLFSGVAAAQSACRGLDANACAGNGACVWQAARVAGQPSPKTGKPYTRPMKAHCRMGARSASK